MPISLTSLERAMLDAARAVVAEGGDPTDDELRRRTDRDPRTIPHRLASMGLWPCAIRREKPAPKLAPTQAVPHRQSSRARPRGPIRKRAVAGRISRPKALSAGGGTPDRLEVIRREWAAIQAAKSSL